MPLRFCFWLSCLTAVAINAVENAQLPENQPQIPQNPEPLVKQEPEVPPTIVHPPQNPRPPPPLVPVTIKPIEPTSFHVTQKPVKPPTSIPVPQKPEKPPTNIPTTLKPSTKKSDDVKFEDQCVCEAYGDPHFKTFDNATFSLLYDCSFIMSQAMSANGNCDFRVEVENERRAKSAYRKRAYIKVVKIFINRMELTIGQDKTFQVDGIQTTLPYDRDNLYVRVIGDYVTMTSSCGVKVEFDGDSSARVTAPKLIFHGQLSGLCGNCDGQSKTDWLPGTLKLRKHGRVTALAKRYAVRATNQGKPRCHAFS